MIVVTRIETPRKYSKAVNYNDSCNLTTNHNNVLHLMFIISKQGINFLTKVVVCLIILRVKTKLNCIREAMMK